MFVNPWLDGKADDIDHSWLERIDP